ncbi:MAG: VOC family protein [Actinomycetota bacterium]
MPTIDKHETGTFCWVELATTDLEAAGDFYSKLFGWQGNTEASEAGGDYTTFSLSGDRAVAGGYVQPEPEREQNIPPHWNIYVYTDEVDKTVARATELGGNAIVAGMDLPFGRMGVISDPTGAVISLWQSDEMPGFSVWREHGSYAWTELLTPDKDKAGSFYSDLFGWTTEEQGEEFGNYTLLKRNGEDVAGMMNPPREGIPPVWMVYFEVTDANAITKAVEEAGGRVEMPATPIPTIGTFAVLADPQGATFAVIHTDDAAR